GRLVFAVEALRQSGEIISERLRGIERYRQFGRLADIAEIGREFQFNTVIRITFFGEHRPPFRLEFIELGGQPFDVNGRQLVLCGAHEIVLDIRRQHAGGGKDTRQDGGNDALDAQYAGDIHGMKRTAAAKGNDGHVARVAAALHRYRTDGACHADIGDLADTLRSLLDGKAERLRDVAANGVNRPVA